MTFAHAKLPMFIDLNGMMNGRFIKQFSLLNKNRVYETIFSKLVLIFSSVMWEFRIKHMTKCNLINRSTQQSIGFSVLFEQNYYMEYIIQFNCNYRNRWPMAASNECVIKREKKSNPQNRWDPITLSRLHQTTQCSFAIFIEPTIRKMRSRRGIYLAMLINWVARDMDAYCARERETVWT